MYGTRVSLQPELVHEKDDMLTKIKQRFNSSLKRNEKKKHLKFNDNNENTFIKLYL